MSVFVNPPGSPGRKPLVPVWLTLIACVGPLLLGLTGATAAADPEDAESLFRAGKYDECAKVAEKEIAEGGGWNERPRYLQVSAEMARGKYADALVTVERRSGGFPAASRCDCSPATSTDTTAGKRKRRSSCRSWSGS